MEPLDPAQPPQPGTPFACEGRTLFVAQARYATGHLRLDIRTADWEPWTFATVNLPDRTTPEGWVWLKRHDQEEIVDALVAAGIVSPAYQTVAEGHVARYASLHQLQVPVTAPPVADPIPAGELGAEMQRRMRAIFPGITIARLGGNE